jgi:hypothetical protein
MIAFAPVDKPQHSYATLIEYAISGSPRKKLTLAQVG